MTPYLTVPKYAIKIKNKVNKSTRNVVLKTWSLTHFEQVSDNWEERNYMLKINIVTLHYVKNGEAWSISGLYFIVFERYTGKYGPGKSAYFMRSLIKITSLYFYFLALSMLIWCFYFWDWNIFGCWKNTSHIWNFYECFASFWQNFKLQAILYLT